MQRRDLESPITEGVRRTVQAIERNHRDDGGTVKQSAGITADVLARIEATAHRPRKRGRGIDGASSHGCRVGMAQDLARTAGVDMPAIMQAGGWRTEKMVARYTAREQAARGAVARFYGTA